MSSEPLVEGEAELRTIYCAACGAPHTFARGVGAPPRYCPMPECAEFGRMTARWASAGKALARAVKRRDGKQAGKGVRMRVYAAVDKATATVKDIVRDEAAV